MKAEIQKKNEGKLKKTERRKVGMKEKIKELKKDLENCITEGRKKIE